MDGSYGAASDSYWQLLDTDRGLYRRTDQINLWGLVRDRADGSVPSEVVVRLVPDGGDAVVPVATVTLKPNSNGVLSGSLPLVEAAEGDYRLELLAGDEVIGQRSLGVGAVEKPAYRLEVTTGHHVYLAGDRIRTTITARFYEGTPMPGVPLRVDGPNRERMVRTDASGVATFATTAVADANELSQAISVNPARGEEGSIGASRDCLRVPEQSMAGGHRLGPGRPRARHGERPAGRLRAHRARAGDHGYLVDRPERRARRRHGCPPPLHRADPETDADGHRL